MRMTVVSGRRAAAIRAFSVTVSPRSVRTIGESHGAAVGVVVDGCPPRLALAVEEIQADIRTRLGLPGECMTPLAEAVDAPYLSAVLVPGRRDGRGGKL